MTFCKKKTAHKTLWMCCHGIDMKICQIKKKWGKRVFEFVMETDSTDADNDNFFGSVLSSGCVGRC